MESPTKRRKTSLPTSGGSDDYVSLSANSDRDAGARYGYGAADTGAEKLNVQPSYGPGAGHFNNDRHDRQDFIHSRSVRHDPRHNHDRPKSRHALPGHEPWILVKTKLGRRFVHNTTTKESYWRIPPELVAGVREYDQWEQQQREKEDNARWAEQELEKMREPNRADNVNTAADKEGRSRRRRSESLQREDEAVLMAELAAEAEEAEEHDVREPVASVQHIQPATQRAEDDYGSDSSYEEVEVTDSEYEGDGDQATKESRAQPSDLTAVPADVQPEPAVEFGEDDIAYQLAAMGEEYGLDAGEYGEEGSEEEWDDGAEGLPLSDEDAANLFRDMLNDHHVNPFTPWDRLIADESEQSILMDDRYTILPSTKARKQVWEAWMKDTAAQRKEERAQMEKLDPRLPYLDLLADKATPKLYWPEFKRKYKREAAMNERKLSDKDREKLYREHINRLTLPESMRKADLVTLLQSIPLRVLNKNTTLDTLPAALRSHLHFISLPRAVCEDVIEQHIARLPFAPANEGGDELSAEQRAANEKQRAARRKREAAMEARERRVGEEKRRAEQESRWAQRDLREEERELDRAMVGASAIQAHLLE